MKLLPQSVMLAVVAFAMAMPVHSMEIDPNNPVHVASMQQRIERLQNATQKSLAGDDEAVKEAIRAQRHISIGSYTTGIFIENMNGFVESGISRERLITALESMIRENLVVIEKKGNETKEHITSCAEISSFWKMLNAFPEHDILPLLKECIESKDEFIRNDATRRYNVIMERTKTQSGARDEPSPATPSSQTEIFSPRPEPIIPIIAPTPTPAPAVLPTQETPPEQPEKSPTNKTVFWVSVIAFLAIIGGVTVMWRKNQ